MSREAVKHIKTWSERCEEHSDHQERIITERMIQERMQEEIDELRQALETEREWVGLTDEEHDNIKDNYHNMTWTLEMFARAVEQALKEKNT
jgi:hypothetical protein